MLYLSLLVLFSLFLVFSNVKASCTTDEWYACEGSYSVHYFINSDCSTNSNSMYCQYGCSGGHCQSAPVTTTTIYSCTPQYLGNYQCSGNWIQQQYQNSDCSLTWQNSQYCSNGCSNGQCVSQPPSQCSIGYTGNYKCIGNFLEGEYRYADCTTSWTNVQICIYGCSNGQCLSTPTCSAQYLNNYQCSGSWQQRQYQNSDCSTTWQNYQYCNSGCSNGQCISTGCTAQYLNNYQCSGNWQQRQYQNSDCSLTWQNYQYCNNGCSNSQCASQACTAQYLDQWQCLNNWRQRQYQYSDCTSVWQNYEYCNNGCSNGDCITQTCTPQYFNNYQCSGNWKQQQYMSDDCSVSWGNVEYCNYGCSGGMCQPYCNYFSCGNYPYCDNYNNCNYNGYDNYNCNQYGCGHYYSACSISASVTNPGDSYVDHVASTIVTFNNNGDSGGYVSFNVFMCDSYNNCQSMICEDSYNRVYSNDGRVYVDGHESRSMTCTLTPTQSCNHRIKVEYYGCNNYNPTIYSGYFSVSSRHPCTAQYLDNYECLGNTRRQQYQDSYCSTTWKAIEVCENGCSNGECVSGSTTTTIPAGEGSPLISVRQDYSVNKCEINSFSFDVMNVGPSSATFSISASGSAADWIRLESPITLEKNEKRSVTAYASVPCGAKGEYDFTVTASGKTSSSATSYLKINEPASTFVFPALRLSPEWLIVLLVIILLIVLLLILFLVLNRRRGCKRGIFYRRCGAESF